MKLGLIVHNYRKTQGVSMDLFCKKSGLSKGYISMIENERNPRSNKPIRPTLPTLEKLASAMDMSMTELFEMLDPDTVVDVSAKDVSSPTLTPGESAHLSRYRALDAEDQDTVDGLTESLLSKSKYHTEDDSGRTGAA